MSTGQTEKTVNFHLHFLSELQCFSDNVRTRQLNSGGEVRTEKLCHFNCLRLHGDWSKLGEKENRKSIRSSILRGILVGCLLKSGKS